MKNNKKFIAIAAAALMVGLVAIAGFNGTLAYLFDGADKNNAFTPALVNIAVTEGNKTIEGGENNYTLGDTKTVTITNLDEPKGKAVPCYIRVRAVPMVKNAAGAVVAMDVSEELILGLSSKGNWVQGKKDWMMYYYKGAVDPGEATDFVLEYTSKTGMELPKGCSLEIQIIADAVQASADAVQDAGWENPNQIYYE